jgi:hypothetical protein
MATVESTANMHVGAQVMSDDGKRVGLVKDVKVDRFLVDARLAPDYWLGSEVIESVSEGIVQLCITKEAVSSAKLVDKVEGPGVGMDTPGSDRPTSTPPSI